MRTKYLLLAGAVALLCAGPAFAAGPDYSGKPCLRVGEVYNWKARDRKSLIIEDDWHRKFLVGLLGYCPDLNFRETLAIRSPGSTRLSCLSPGDDIVTRQFGMGRLNCPVRSVSYYTPDMEKADKDAAAAKKAEREHGSSY
ncbi:MAG: hypothetical protein HY243_05710 [Proteobacteria bacterium]|nr:hypothetical protein [Pseudomonadota bacterium]